MFNISEFRYTPTFLVTFPLESIWKGFSCGSDACEVPLYDPVETGVPSNSTELRVKLLNVIESLSLSDAAIVPTTAPLALFSFILLSVWLFTIGTKLSVTFNVIVKEELASVSCPAS